MQSVREVAKSIIAEMEGIQRECNPVQAEYFRRLAVISYADALKSSPMRSPELTEQSIQEAYAFSQKAIALGIREERMETSFSNLRDYWLPRLKEISHAKD